VSNEKVLSLVSKTLVIALACLLLGRTVCAQDRQTGQNGTYPVADNAPAKHSSGVLPPLKLKLRKYVAPDYPAIARKAHVQGQVTIQAHITKQGRVKTPQFVSGHPMFRDATLAAVRRWRYEPARLQGVPLALDYYLIIVNFNLQDGVTVK
jgi:TonB family protein